MAINLPGLSPASTGLGLGYGGDELANESDEERRKRMLEAQQRQRLGGMNASPATRALFGMGAAGLYPGALF
jgi:hypothetical protein